MDDVMTNPKKTEKVKGSEVYCFFFFSQREVKITFTSAMHHFLAYHTGLVRKHISFSLIITAHDIRTSIASAHR